MSMAKGRVLIDGTANGDSLKLTAAISFWGGVNPHTGSIVDPRHPQHNACLTNRVLFLPATVGSSSSSAIMLELVRLGTTPAALVLGETDAILVLGVLVAEEIGHPTIPVVELAPSEIARIPDRTPVRVLERGEISWES